MRAYLARTGGPIEKMEGTSLMHGMAFSLEKRLNLHPSDNLSSCRMAAVSLAAGSLSLRSVGLCNPRSTRHTPVARARAPR